MPSGTNWNDVADLNYLNFEMRTEMIDALSYWVTEFDIDGYRCDYAGGVPRTFWETARTELDQIKPLFWLAEDDSQFTLLENAFEANYAFAMMNTINGVGAGSHDAEDIRAMLDLNEGRYPSGRFPLYYATNHDANAWEGSIPDLLGNGEFALATLVFTIPGMPLIYSGQEVGLDRELRFFDKDEIDWTGWETNATFHFYQKLAALKKQNPALWHGLSSTLDFLGNDDPDVLVYVRTSRASRVIVILNLSDTSRFLEVSLGGAEGTYRDYFGGETITIGETMSIRLAAWDYRVYIRS
ncbi:MAG: alpha-amylase family glycosyl hydrolase [Bacillota bacterium]|nr:alpha-amylase family glycosyl hydrolase [Bacillota bacterium]